MQFFAPCKPPPPPKEKLVPGPPVVQSSEGMAASPDSAETGHPPPSGSQESATQGLPIPPQRYPQLAVLDVVSEISRQLAEDTRSPEQTRQAVDQLVAILKSNSLTPGERDYLSTIASYFLGGFESDAGTAATSTQKPTTKGLFSEEEDSAEHGASSKLKPTHAAKSKKDDDKSIEEENAPGVFR